MSANYKNVNAVWPEETPAPTGQEAIAGMKRLVRMLYRFAQQEKGWPKSAAQPPRRRYVLTSGRRYTRLRGGVWYVNPNERHFGGWQDIVHHVSHWAVYKFWPTDKGHHTPRHAYIEKMCAEYVIKNGWLEGKLRREPKSKPPVDLKAERLARIVEREKRWQAKQKRAQTALRKLAKQRRYYEARV